MGNKILLRSFDNSLENGWGNAIKTSFEQIGLLNVYLGINQGKKSPNCIIFCREKDIFQQSALSNIQNISKLKTYALLKNNINQEKYLTIIKNVSHRIALTKLRLSNHILMIEKGRHQSQHLFDRTCPFCPNKIENEQHFILKCPTYSHLRERLLDDIRNTTNSPLPEDDYSLFVLLLGVPEVSADIAKFIKNSMELRTFLLFNARNRW